MIVCVCANANEATIENLINQGKSFEDLQREINVCCKCCCCREYLENMYKEKKDDMEIKAKH